MILISHRGNLNGKLPQKENHPDYIDEAIHAGYDVEIDIWLNDGVFYLGHDAIQYEITPMWLYQRVGRIWVHCKNTDAIEWFHKTGGFNYFWHQEDTLTITSRGHLWVYPGKQPIENSIAVMPEIHNDNVSKCLGICSDYIQNYKK